MKKDEKEPAKISTNSWMTTYTDLMILLLTFFVLLLSMATIDKRRKRLALDSLVGAFGFKPGGQSILGNPKGLNITAGSPPLVKEDIQFERLRNIALRHGMISHLNTSKQLDRTVITIKDKTLFDHGSYTLKPDTVKFLSELAGILKGGSGLIELRGYTDSSETVFDKDPMKSAMFLSAKRAMTIFYFFHDQIGIPAESMVAHGFGLNPEIVVNKGKNSYINRQVEIILDRSEAIPYKMKKTGKIGAILDFKGFFFRTPGDLHGK
ncbi:OmpA family protein [bacterium]|nr:OmpA family protein [bacterium]